VRGSPGRRIIVENRIDHGGASRRRIMNHVGNRVRRIVKKRFDFHRLRFGHFDLRTCFLDHHVHRRQSFKIRFT
jgi:hypothetical protein